jgi:hypothetical protein
MAAQSGMPRRLAAQLPHSELEGEYATCQESHGPAL